MARLRSTRPARRENRVARRPMFYGDPDPITLNRMEALVANVSTMQREALTRGEPDPRRDIADECGYPKVGLDAELYRDLIRWEPVASAVAEAFTLEAFQVLPDVYEDEDAKTDTELESAVDEMSKSLEPEPSYHEDTLNTAVNNLLIRADILAGYCRYGVIVLGLRDGKAMSEPATPRKNQKLDWARPFPESLCQITQFELRQNHPRRGLPTQYNVYFSDPFQSHTSGAPEPTDSQLVHWSRVVHLADQWHKPATSRCFAVPRIEPVLRPILDIVKVRGASAESYFRGGFPGLQFSTYPQFGADVEVDFDEVRDVYEEYVNGMQRLLIAIGGQYNTISPGVTDPKAHLDTQLEAISISKRWPKRILMGSERGEQSSIDDRKNWKGRLQGAQLNYYTPCLIARFYNRLISLGVLPKPRKSYKIFWPDIDTLTDLEKAQVLQTRTTAYVAYGQGMEALVPPLDYMTRFDSMEVEEAEQILQSAGQNLEEGTDTGAPLLGLVGGVGAILGMFDRFQAGAISEETLAQLIMLFYKVDEEKARAIIADGLPDPPAGMPPAPPLKGAKTPPSASPIVANWLVTNLFCATGPGGGVDPSCKVGEGQAKARGGKAKEAKRKVNKAAAEARAMQKGAKEKAQKKVEEPRTTEQAITRKERVKVALFNITQHVREGLEAHEHPLKSSGVESIAKTAVMVQKMAGVDSTVALAAAVATYAFGGAALERVKKGMKWLDKKLYQKV